MAAVRMIRNPIILGAALNLSFRLSQNADLTKVVHQLGLAFDGFLDRLGNADLGFLIDDPHVGGPRPPGRTHGCRPHKSAPCGCSSLGAVHSSPGSRRTPYSYPIDLVPPLRVVRGKSHLDRDDYHGQTEPHRHCVSGEKRMFPSERCPPLPTPLVDRPAPFKIKCCGAPRCMDHFKS